ncbi:NtaA/DmoA family FMN-dependent monooxygenase [Arthrobacter bambusae]|uniref:NtaA/DmoA family FMN-dependent monooxygenase n=1 Tax=Arthrobacter bambusae TaxID=1338426 RepID=UPI001F50CD81|nr:NtaA/DmoA family FMN-dependent monooxygenase [Arthrobacter bambusae]MCI0144092.1 NtaA/DmoA family FMN-dependent monooxygenase [Arthrobacter bambusae]
MPTREDLMSLVMFFSDTGRMNSAWRLPNSPVEELYTLDLPTRIVQQAERAKFDAVFFANVIYKSANRIGKHPFSTGYEPLTLLSGLAARTTNIGLIATASMTFIHPFNLARFLASVDWLSDGRVGWNAVTSSGGEEHYGIELPPKATRYKRADEFMRVVDALWDAWDDDAVINDRAAGEWTRSDSVHPVDFEGEFFKVQGQLHMHRSPQGRPVIVQAGQSPEGIKFAARHAEVVFTAQTELEAAKHFYKEIKDRAVAEGRDPDSIKVLPGLTPIVAETSQGAREFRDHLGKYLDLEAGINNLSVAMQANLSALDPEKPIPTEMLVKPENANRNALGASRYDNFYNMAVRDRLTIREIVMNNDIALGHGFAMGAPGDVADHMQEWFEERACDGFAIAPVTIPEGHDSVCNLLIPELQRRGLAKRDYVGKTLRENLGLARPATGTKRDIDEVTAL